MASNFRVAYRYGTPPESTACRPPTAAGGLFMPTSTVLYLGMRALPAAPTHPMYSRSLSLQQLQSMGIGKAVNTCHRCGATSYRPVMARAADGNMRPSGQYSCIRCKLVFITVKEWRQGLEEPQGSAS